MSRLTRVFALVLLSPVGAFAQYSFTCMTNIGSPALIRAEGRTERVSDVVITCTGGISGLGGSGSITLSFGTNVTSQILVPATSASEGFLLIDELQQTPTVGANVFQGVVAENQITFNNVPFVSPGPGTRTFRMTNLRILASGLPAATPIFASISISGSSSLPINNPIVVVGLSAPGMQFALQGADGSPAQSLPFSGSANQNLSSAVLTNRLQFSEGFNTSFRKRNAGTTPATPGTLINQASPGTDYGTETGFYLSSLPSTNGLNTAGLASQGTRLLATFTNVPAGVTLYVTTAPLPGTNSPSAALVSATDSSGDGSFVATSATNSISINGTAVGLAPVALSGGSGIATWEVLNTNPAALETYTFGIVAQYSSITGSAQVTGTLAPTTSVVTADNVAPLPRFANSNLIVPTQCASSSCLQTLPTAIAFSHVAGSTDPSPVTLQVASTGAPLSYAVSVTSTQPGWISVTPTSGTTPSSLQVSFALGYLPASVYQATITLSSPNSLFPPVSIPVILTVTAAASGPGPLACVANVAVPPQMRQSGMTETLGDIVLTCINGTPTASGVAVPAYDVQVVLPTPITSRTYSNGWSEALLLVDEPGSGLPGPGPAASQVACATSTGICPMTGNGTGITYRQNVFPGRVSGNTVIFPSIPFDPPGTAGVGLGTFVSRVFRITNLRTDVSGVTLPVDSSLGPLALSATISAGPIPINYQYGYSFGYPFTYPPTYVPNGPTVVPGFVQQDVTVSMRTPDNTAASTGGLVNQCASTGPQRTGVVRFAEQFATTFKPRTAPTSSSPPINPDVSPAPTAQNTVGTIYNSESGFYTPLLTSPNVDFTTVGLANSGTRLRAQIANVPAGSRIWVSTLSVQFTNGVPAAVTAQNASLARAIQNESGAFSPLAATTTLEGIPAVEVSLVNGAGTAVWEVMQANPNAQEYVDFLIWVQAGSAVSTSAAIVTGSLAAAPPSFADSGSHQASSTLPVPRFAAGAAALTAFSVANCSAVLFVTASTLPDGQASLPYSLTLIASGVPPYSYTASAGSLPGWLALSSSGVLSGTPPAAGDFNFTITVTDHLGSQASRTFSLHLAAAPAPPSAIGIGAENASPAYYGAFDAYFSDPLGASDLSNLAIWFTGSTASAANSCQISYDPVAQVFGLLDDAGQTVLHAAAGTALIRNSQCVVDLPNSSVSLNVINPILRVSVRFLTGFAGVKGVYSRATAIRGVDSGWQLGLTWTVGSPGGVSVTVTPSSASGLSQTFTVQATDAAGAADIESVWIWLSNSPGPWPEGSCFLEYYPTNYTFRLDGGTSVGVQSNLVYHNNECILDASRLSAVASGNTLTLTIPITFKAAFHGTWNIYTASSTRSSSIVYQGPQGTFTVPTLPTPGLATYISPTSATLGQPVTARMVLGGSPTPTGKVTFYDGTTVLGTATLNNGQASFTTSLLPVGSRSLSAYYSGDSNWAPVGHGVSSLATISAASENAFSLANYGTGLTPNSVAFGDFNGDGKTDLVTTNAGNGILSVLLGNGDGTFQPAVGYGSGLWNASFVAVADFNADGKLDLAVARPTNGLVILIGNGDGSFQAPLSASSGESQQIAVGDFDGDGNADLAYVNGSGLVFVSLGNGDGTFEPPLFFTVGSGASWVAVGDFNKDGNADLAVANTSSNTISILLGNGNGTFQWSSTLNTLAAPSSITVADFNGDGYQDLAVGCGGGVSVFSSVGNGTFQSPLQIPIGAVGSIAAGRFTGTGKIDLAVSNTADHQVEILPGNGDGTFGSSLVYAPGSYPDHAIVAADFNRDGRSDLAFVSGTKQNVGVLLGSLQPVLGITETHTGNFMQGQAGAKYTVTVSNAASAAATSGTVTVTETIPVGMTLVSMAGTGWTCPPGGTSCTRNDSLNGGFSYPPITVTVNVAANATTPLTNQLTVSGGGSPVATASDVTSILVATVAMVQSSANPSVVNQAVTFIVTVTPSAATGSVQFVVDGNNLGAPVTVSGGAAMSGAISTLAPGNHTVTATFTGSGNYGGSSGTVSGGQTVNTTFTAALSGAITSKQGPANARVWTFSVTYTGAGTALAAQISGVTFTQTGSGGGQPCTPVIATLFPVQVGNIAAGGSAQGNITVDFSACANAAQFSVGVRLAANNGAITGSISRNHEYR
jgi:Bacterial Ig-like domain (group 3)/FG-GAP-like repeat/Domain of unknown function DUF11/FG-GAP repeat